MQTIGNHTVQLLKHKITGERFAKLDGRQIIPLEICAMGAGRDAWLRKIVAKCCECREKYPVTDLTGSGYCWSCVEAEIQAENNG